MTQKRLALIFTISSVAFANSFPLLALDVEPLAKSQNRRPVPLRASVGSSSSLRFEPNMGQGPEGTQYVARGGGYTVAIDSQTAALMLDQAGNRSVVKINLSGAAQSRGVVGARLNSVTHYYGGSDPSKWRTNVPNYGQVRFSNIYPKIDLVYYGAEGRLEYDLILQPGADPKDIRLTYSGTDSLSIDDHGDLVMKVGDRTVRQQKPLVYQELFGHKVLVNADYRILNGTHEVQLALGLYDTHQRLVIDPALVYSSTLGGSPEDLPAAIALDSKGSVYVTGVTTGGFPTVAAAQSAYAGSEDVFVSKLGPSGEVVYSTYLGGRGADRGLGIAVDGAGNAYITGSTTGDFPTRDAYQPNAGGGTDAFLVKLDPGGNLAYSSYLGGVGADRGNGIAVDSSGSIVIVGSSTGAFPLLNGSRETSGAAVTAFAAKFNANGSLVYSTYLGSSGDSTANGVAMDSTGCAQFSEDTR